MWSVASHDSKNDPSLCRPWGTTIPRCGGDGMTAAVDCRIVGRWRIVETDLWGREYLDLCRPATLVIDHDGQGELAFGALQAGLDLAYSRSMVLLTWSGHDEIDEGPGTVSPNSCSRRHRDRVQLPQRR